MIASAFGTEPSAYAELAAARDGASACGRASRSTPRVPHVKAGGIEFGQDPKLLGELVRDGAGPQRRGRLLVKLSPNVTRIADMARGL